MRTTLGLLISLLPVPSILAGPLPVPVSTQSSIHLKGSVLDASLDPTTGCISGLSLTGDPNQMNWVHYGTEWGSGWITLENKRVGWTLSNFQSNGQTSATSTYAAGPFTVTVVRTLDPRQFLTERYTFTNTSAATVTIPKDGLGIQTPFNDSYAGGASVCLTGRCNAHIWCADNTAYICATRMDGAPPGLGLVLTHGSVSGYSLENTKSSDDRGSIILHPAPMTLAAGASSTVSWVVLAHAGWDDFYRKAAAFPAFVQMKASDYSLELGRSVSVVATFSGPIKPHLNADGHPLASKLRGHVLTATYRPASPGEHVVSVVSPDASTFLRIFVTPPPMDLIAARVKFIVEHQQRNAPGTPLDGAYLIYDNETGQQIYNAGGDHDAGRERVGMGCLIARYLLICKDPALARELHASLDRYYRYVNAELTDESGTVYNDVGRQGTSRLYNYPWVAELHLLMYKVTGDGECLHRYVNTCHQFYSRAGARPYFIGMPIREGLSTLKSAGLTSEYDALLQLYTSNADQIEANGVHIPREEISYEQSIVGPAVQILAETYRATGKSGYLDSANTLLPLLESFDGWQPDYHLNDIGIRHWDDYWFGKTHQFGDTFPHYWTTITAVAFHDLALAEHKPALDVRARKIAANNLCLFRPDGQASCAYLYPDTVNGTPGHLYDAWSNDQDWALDNYLIVMGSK